MIRPLAQVVVSLVIASILPAGAAAAPGDLADRWSLADLYATPAAWETAKAGIEEDLETIDRCRGRLGESAPLLKECFDDLFRVTKEFRRLYSYAAMSSDADVRDQEAMARRHSLIHISAALQP